MKIYRTFSDHAAARITDHTSLVSAEKCSQQNHRTTHSSCIFRGNFHSTDFAAVKIQIMALPPGNDSQNVKDFFHITDIKNTRTASQNTDFPLKQ